MATTTFKRARRALVALRKSLAGLTYPPADLQDLLGLGVGPEFPKFFELAVAPKSIVLPREVGQTTFKVTAKRLNKFPEAVTLSVAGLPKEVKAKIAPIAKGKNDAAVTLSGAADLPAGEHKLTITGVGTFQNQPLTVTLADVQLRVAPALEISVASSGDLKPGGKQKLKVTVQRNTSDKAEVALELQNLPEGLTAPAGLKIPADKNEAEVELSAAESLTPQQAKDIKVVAKAKIQGKDIVAESSPIELEVKEVK